ncbi:hypothetical protein PR048_013631 [Dryococelus australis]|uniref:Uncharacterized protein n=1 Tax=Dryococelus australis TaxID=614101 RepID=A0ABQ9HSQ5_9NEOP|nr:hypothetical protein PR048_013631 [Dryococelus australis]
MEFRENPIYPRLCICVREFHFALQNTQAELTGRFGRLLTSRSCEPMRMIEVYMEQEEETGNPRENPPTNGIIRQDSHMRKSESPWWEASGLTAQPPWLLKRREYLFHVTGPKTRFEKDLKDLCATFIVRGKGSFIVDLQNIDCNRYHLLSGAEQLREATIRVSVRWVNGKRLMLRVAVGPLGRPATSHLLVFAFLQRADATSHRNTKRSIWSLWLMFCPSQCLGYNNHPFTKAISLKKHQDIVQYHAHTCRTETGRDMVSHGGIKTSDVLLRKILPQLAQMTLQIRHRCRWPKLPTNLVPNVLDGLESPEILLLCAAGRYPAGKWDSQAAPVKGVHVDAEFPRLTPAFLGFLQSASGGAGIIGNGPSYHDTSRWDNVPLYNEEWITTLSTTS